MKHFFKTFFLMALLVGFSSSAWASTVGKNKPQNMKDPKLIEAGKITYFKRCSFCHGLTGDGEGPVAQLIDPKPRDFTQPLFKFRTTASGVLPTDEDLFRTISRGITGTPMTFFDGDISKVGLSEQERWELIAFIQTLNEYWADDEEFKNSDDPDDKEDYRYNKVLVKYNDLSEPALDPAKVERGKAVYLDKKCWECHGPDGRGNGESNKTLKTDRGFKVHARDLTKPWKYKGGNGIKDIFTRFTTGINGTPMPSFVDTITEEDRWALAHFVKSLQYVPTDKEVLVVKKIEGDIPMDPNDPKWAESDFTDLKLTGMVPAKPRWQNFAVDLVTVRALYNDQEIAFKLQWNDRTEDVEHDPIAEPVQGGKTLWQSYTDKPENGLNNVVKTYVEYYDPAALGISPDLSKQEFWKLRNYGKLRDAIALQFPAKKLMGTARPHFLNGDSQNPVNLWRWEADTEQVHEYDAKGIFKKWKDKGISKQITTQSNKGALKSMTEKSKKIWVGEWQLVMKRSLTTENAKKEIQFEPGKFYPIAVNAWDGGNGESGTNKSVSTWNVIVLEKPLPKKVYVMAFLGFLVVGLLEFIAVKKVNGKSKA